MIDTLLMPFQFGFMQNAFLVALMLAPATAMLSCFLVLKGWSLWMKADPSWWWAMATRTSFRSTRRASCRPTTPSRVKRSPR